MSDPYNNQMNNPNYPMGNAPNNYPVYQAGGYVPPNQNTGNNYYSPSNNYPSNNYQNQNNNPPQYQPGLGYGVPIGSGNEPIPVYNIPANQYNNRIPAPSNPQIYVQLNQPNVLISRQPTPFFCPYCRQNIITQVDFQPSDKTYTVACILCCLTGVICCLIPFCMSDCQDAIHTCPQCKGTIGKVEF